MKRLVVERQGKVVREQTFDAAMDAEGSLVVKGGRHKNQRGLPVGKLLTDTEGSSLYLERCDGHPMRMPRSAFEPDPNRYLLVRNSRGDLKMLDMGAADAKPKLMTRRITRIQIEP